MQKRKTINPEVSTSYFEEKRSLFIKAETNNQSRCAHYSVETEKGRIQEIIVPHKNIKSFLWGMGKR